MKMTRCKKMWAFIVCMVLIAAMTLFTTGCNDNQKEENPKATESTELTENVETPEPKNTEDSESGEATVLGEGAKQFMFTVVDGEGKETPFEIHTEKETVGEALVELGLVEGEQGDYGLYVKTVNGITVDYDTDGKYWAFYMDDQYASTGVDQTPITEGASYSFKVE